MEGVGETTDEECAREGEYDVWIKHENLKLFSLSTMYNKID